MQALEPTDFLLRIIYCEWLLQQCRDRPNFLNCILFTDEVGFTRNAVFNTHNTHISTTIFVWNLSNNIAKTKEYETMEQRKPTKVRFNHRHGKFSLRMTRLCSADTLSIILETAQIISSLKS